MGKEHALTGQRHVNGAWCLHPQWELVTDQRLDAVGDQASVIGVAGAHKRVSDVRSAVDDAAVLDQGWPICLLAWRRHVGERGKIGGRGRDQCAVHLAPLSTLHAQQALLNLIQSGSTYLIYTWWPAMHESLDIGYEWAVTIKPQKDAELRIVRL